MFVNTSELLQVVINDAWSRGGINLPIDEDFGQKYPILQYADDTLMIMPMDQTQLLHLKEILANLCVSTVLHVNYNKTTLVPINIGMANANSLATIFGCKTKSLPFTYLGLPLGTTRPLVDDLMPMVSRLDKNYLVYHHLCHTLGD
jgi:hypothetical protein